MANKFGPAGRNGLWLIEHVLYDGDGCLMWPFARDTRGYAQVAFDGKVRRGHRIMCELVNGPPPTPEHHAAHNCGKGSSGCVHPKHVEWKTGSENQLDRKKHGTHYTGGRRRKLTPVQVLEIRAAKGKITQRALADKYGIADSTVRGIQTRRYWNHL